MGAGQDTLPYSVSTGSAYTSFDKLQGANNYMSWKRNMRIVLLSPRQWGLITGTVKARPLQTVPNRRLERLYETNAIEAFEARSISAFVDIFIHIPDSAKSILGSIEDPKAAWELLENRFCAKQHGLQSVLLANLHLTKWDGSGTIHSHRNAMVNLREKLVEAGMTISDQSFHEYFTNSLPSSLNLFITLYDDPTYHVDLLCDKFAECEIRCKLADAKASKAEETSDRSLALFGQQASSSSKRKGKRREAHYLLRVREEGLHQIKMSRWRKERTGRITRSVRESRLKSPMRRREWRLTSRGPRLGRSTRRYLTTH